MCDLSTRLRNGPTRGSAGQRDSAIDGGDRNAGRRNAMWMAQRPYSMVTLVRTELAARAIDEFRLILFSQYGSQPS
jgi:hypothetical protein